MTLKFNDFTKEYKSREKEYLNAIKKVLESGWYILGNEVESFEERFAKYLGTKYCIGVGNGLEALQISLMALGIGKGDEVITTPISAVATTLSIMAVGAKPVFAIDNDAWAIENAKENVRRNRVQHQMTVALGSISRIPRITFDCIIANIDFRTISRFISSLRSRTRRNGIILFSGILTSDLPVLLKLFKKNNLVPLEIIDENEWTAVALRRM